MLYENPGIFIIKAQVFAGVSPLVQPNVLQKDVYLLCLILATQEPCVKGCLYLPI
jgi:hypothetical protein